MAYEDAAPRPEPTGDDRPVRLRPLTLALLAVGVIMLPLYAAVMARQLDLGAAWAAFCAAVGMPSGA